jgi:NADH:ubiquinone oxidoreductase subunit B-like Fe-S oxidoreductase
MRMEMRERAEIFMHVMDSRRDATLRYAYVKLISIWPAAATATCSMFVMSRSDVCPCLFHVSSSSDCESGYEEETDDTGAGTGKKSRVIYKHGCPHRSELCQQMMQLLDSSVEQQKKHGTVPVGRNKELSNKHIYTWHI